MHASANCFCLSRYVCIQFGTVTLDLEQMSNYKNNTLNMMKKVFFQNTARCKNMKVQCKLKYVMMKLSKLGTHFETYLQRNVSALRFDHTVSSTPSENLTVSVPKRVKEITFKNVETFRF